MYWLTTKMVFCFIICLLIAIAKQIIREKPKAFLSQFNFIKNANTYTIAIQDVHYLIMSVYNVYVQNKTKIDTVDSFSFVGYQFSWIIW